MSRYEIFGRLIPFNNNELLQIFTFGGILVNLVLSFVILNRELITNYTKNLNSTKGQALAPAQFDYGTMKLMNVALNKPGYANKIYKAFYPSYATDGKIDTRDKFYHSGNGVDNAWLQIDLLQNFWIVQIQILPMGRSPHNLRFGNIMVKVGIENSSNPFTSYSFVGTYYGPYGESNGFVSFIPENPIYGRYVGIIKFEPGNSTSNSYFLEILEVQVIAIVL